MASSSKQYKKEYYQRNRQKICEQTNEWRKRNRAKVSASHQAYRRRMLESDPHWERKASYRKRYDITLEQYDAILSAQNNSCAICFGPPRGRLRFHVDHDHQTGRVRGLLCWRCNSALGNLDEDVAILSRMIAYLT